MKIWGKSAIQFAKTKNQQNKDKNKKLDDLSWPSVLLFVTFHGSCETFWESLRILSDTLSQCVELTNHILSSEPKRRGCKRHTFDLEKTWFLLRSCIHAGDKPGHEADPSMSQEGKAAHRRNAEVAGRHLRSDKWHKVEVSKTTAMLLKPCCKTHYSSTYFHFVLFPLQA